MAVLSVLLSPAVFALPSIVTVSGRQLIVQKRLNDNSLAPAAPYIIRGVVWSPASTDTSTGLDDRRAEYATHAATDIPLFAAMNVNTVYMVLDPGLDAAGTNVLDQLHAAGIMAVMTADNGNNDLARVDSVAAFYKDHPALLGWILGNEWNINRYGQPISVLQAAQQTETAAQHVKAIDTNHPVISSYGEIDINASGMYLADTQNYVNNVCVSVDVWAVNVYRGKSFLNLFTQWASISTKPMLIGEFGADAFRSSDSIGVGNLDDQMQTDWDIALWNEIFLNLSANTPEAVVIGGFVFEWNDEWWKVAPVGTQERGGYGGAFPDSFSNEEFYGIVDINRAARPVYNALTAAFAAAYDPPRIRPYRVVSLGAAAEEWGSQYGNTWLIADHDVLYRQNGGGGGGRGFNVVVIDPATEDPWQPPQNFDTWGSAAEFCDLNTFLDSVPNGMLILIGVADDPALTGDPCGALPANACRTGTIARLQALGSDLIDDYCFRNSWAMAAVKGEADARDEQLGVGVQAIARTTLPMVQRTLALNVAGAGIVRSVPAGLNCTASCNRLFPMNQEVTLHSVVPPNSFFYRWSNDCGGTTPCTTTLSANRTVGATFAGPGMSGDFNGDGRDDLLWRESATGHTVEWQMNGAAITASNNVHLGGNTGWAIVAIDDFDADSRDDILWRELATGQTYLWQMNGFAITSSTKVHNGGNTAWAVVSVGDFDGDGRADILWRNPTTGQTYLWLMNGAAIVSSTSVHTGGNTAWSIIGSADFNDDGRNDVLWRHNTGGQTLLWLMNGPTITASLPIHPGNNTGWTIPALGDINNDDRADILWRNTATGASLYWQMNGAAISASVNLHPGGNTNWLVIALADFDGDGDADILLRDSTTGETALGINAAQQVHEGGNQGWHVMTTR